MELFLNKLSISNNLDFDKVLGDWKQFDETNIKYNKMKKPELVEMCKTGGFKSKGTKPELISFLFNEVVEIADAKVEKKKKSLEPPPVAKTSILEKMKMAVDPVNIRRNKYDNYEHAESGFVFDNKTKKVIGKQQGEEVIQLNKEDIDTCNKFRFSYEIPESLGVGDEIDKEIDDLDESGLLDIGGGDDEESDEEIEY